MKYCPNCGASTEEGQKFCGECGAKLETAPLPKEPVYTDDERLKNDPVLNRPTEFTPKKKEEKIPELTLEPDLWGMGAAAVAAAPAEAAKPAEAAAPAQAAQTALPAERQEAPSSSAAAAERDYERPDAEYHGPAQGSQGDYRAPVSGKYNTLPNDYTMSGQPQKSAQKMPDGTQVKKMPDETLMLVWSIILTCLCSVCGIVGLVKTIKARSALNANMKYKLLSSAKIWLIVGTALHVLPLLAELF